MEKLKDVHVREVLLNELHKTFVESTDTRIINELGIDFGQSRIDVAVVNGILHGYEIKSESDNLNRLPNQMLYYNKLFERMTIVVDQKHFEHVVGIVPRWWGITVVKSVKGKISFSTKRKGRRKTSQDKETLLKLLWKDELENLIDFLGYPKQMKKIKKSELLEIFNAETKLEVIRPFVYNALKNRQFWRS
ncbi:sce7726 family protein [Paenibacillus sp. NPDC057934]|uniref:sce7726 family protein n=1 Tax=Paenibacillus sp. NPDC057934 TaxID=3346282 RepID=UPI0036DC5D9D